MPARLLAIYLNDHLAGATVGVELAQRTARENDGAPLGTFLRGTLLPELVEDRNTLMCLMAELGIARSRPKLAAAWILEKLGRLKPNGEVRHYSPLSRLLELEGLAAGIDAKKAMWLALASVKGSGGRTGDLDFAALAESAASQRSRLEEHRLAAAASAFG